MTPNDLLSLGDALDLFRDPDTGHTDKGPRPRDALIQRGLIPPMPITAGPNPALVWGWPTVRRAAELGVEEVETRTFHLNPADALFLALQLESRPGRFSWTEQEAIVSYLERTLQRRDGDGEVSRGVETEAGNLHWPEVSRLVRGDGALVELVGRYRRLGAGLRVLVNDEFISLRTAERIARVPGDFLTTHRPSLDSLSFSARRQYLELLAELIVQSRAHGGTGASLIRARASAALDDRDPVQSLRRWRYPTLTNLEDQFREIRRVTLHGTGVDLEAPPYFEGDSFSVSFRFRNCAELVERTRALERLKGCCDQLFGIL